MPENRPALVLVHGRSQQMPAAARRGPAEEAAFVARKRQGWLAGLAKGLVLAGLPPVDESRVSFPYYGNEFADAIAAHEKRGGARPNLALEPGAELAADGPATPLPRTTDALILEAAAELGYAPDRDAEADTDDPEMGRAWEGYRTGAELDLGPILRPRLLRSALQYIARKTGATELIIERFLTDVGYYLDVPRIRDLVLGIVADDVRKAADQHGSVVVVAHSLGSVVGYDVFDTLAGEVDVRLLVTSGSPLGFPVVKGALRPSGTAQRAAPAAKGGAVPWLNAYDVQDFVCLVHPLRRYFGEAPRDERTHNASDPHSIQDYLGDPDVARPIGRALAGRAPW
jgi:hypothetical protein